MSSTAPKKKQIQHVIYSSWYSLSFTARLEWKYTRCSLQLIFQEKDGMVSSRVSEEAGCAAFQGKAERAVGRRTLEDCVG